MRREIRALQRRLGITMLYVTHDQVEAMTMADRVILMRAGRIEQNGAPAELYERPATTFAARFIGAPPMNVFPAVHLAMAAAGGSGPAGRSLDQLALGVRPESIRIADQGLPVTVVASEYLGADTQVETRLGDEVVLVRSPGRLSTVPGATIHLAWDKDAAHWFDLSSGCRIQ
jgi:sn-glycerol 3-phosphate transport system ATP-binding protein